MSLLSISNEDIEKYVKESLLNAGLGEAIRKSVGETLTNNWDNPIKKAVSKYVEGVAMDLIKTKFSSEINALLEEVIRDFIDRKGFEFIFNSLKNKLNDLDLD